MTSATSTSVKTASAQLVSAVFDEKTPGSLASVMNSTVRAGRLVRDRVSLDTFRVLSSIDEELTAARRNVQDYPLSALQEVALLRQVGIHHTF